uniref:Ribokinase n=1 Tax=Tetraselmis sp. GSL018 TaxID=582737 RepID=A0A061QID1_9CHLO
MAALRQNTVVTVFLVALITGFADQENQVSADLGKSVEAETDRHQKQSHALFSTKSHILIVGSVNVDTTVLVERLPEKHETLVASSPVASVTVGGKGANQAVAVSRLGRNINVRFVTQFGNDANAGMLEQVLLENDVDLRGSSRCSDLPSGQGIVLLEQEGSVSSVVASGCNSVWNETAISRAVQQVRGARVVLLQREVPEVVNVRIATAAVEHGATVLLDAGGEDRPLDLKLLQLATFICPNEGELGRLTGLPTETNYQVLEAAKLLQKDGARNVLVTLGARGAMLLKDGGDVIWQEPKPVPGENVVDSTAAGDAFRAALAVALFEDLSLQRALSFAAAAGAVVVSRAGAVPALPWRHEVDGVSSDSHSISENQSEKNSSASACSTTGLYNAANPSGLLGGGDGLTFASRLNSMTARLDLWDGGTSTAGLIARQGRIKGLSSVFFNYPQHLKGEDPEVLQQALLDANLTTGAVCMRFPEWMGRGAFTNPNSSVRREAVRLTVEGCEWARRLGADELVIWPQTDGYDYHLQVNYLAAWDRAVECYREVCDRCADLRVSLEFKPTDERARFSVVPSTAAALLLAGEVGRPNMGLTLDLGHMLMAGENPAQSIGAALWGSARGRAPAPRRRGRAHPRVGAPRRAPRGRRVAAALGLRRAHLLRHVPPQRGPRPRGRVQRPALPAGLGRRRAGAGRRDRPPPRRPRRDRLAGAPRGARAVSRPARQIPPLPSHPSSL